MDILRFITAGNIDDGKSTLIGRLLYDIGQIKSDIIQSVSKSDKTLNSINLAHITDGLRSEREQGITIDIAYKYFTTQNRKYIITDAPGHFQYTKNLVTGASEVDAMIILIDANIGITEQTRRHSLVASFLNIPNVLVAINKMDNVAYNEEIFISIKNQFLVLAKKLKLQNISFFPISALMGDNVNLVSSRMTWYNGITLMQCLETINAKIPNSHITRFSVQCIIETKDSEKGFAGKLISGNLKIGDSIEINPERKSAIIKNIIIGNTYRNDAIAGDDICIYFENGVEAKRGDLIIKNEIPLFFSNKIEATLCWLNDEKQLQIGEEYLLRINSFEIKCRITSIRHKIDIQSFEKNTETNLSAINDFLGVIIETAEVIAFDSFSTLPETGCGIIIDLKTNYTSAAFIIEK